MSVACINSWRKAVKATALPRIGRSVAWPLAVILFTGPSWAAGRADLEQRQAIASVVHELDYLIDHGERLAAKYARDAQPIRFNYPAFLSQLRVTRERAAAYLNEAHDTVTAQPPAAVVESVTVRQ